MFYMLCISDASIELVIKQMFSKCFLNDWKDKHFSCINDPSLCPQLTITHILLFEELAIPSPLVFFHLEECPTG